MARNTALALALLGLATACSSPQHTPPPAATPPADAGARPGVEEPSDDGLVCAPVNYFCGCTWECALLREVEGGSFTRLDSEGAQQFERDDCSAGPCFEICEGERCEPALVMPGRDCYRSCPPSRATFSCRRVPGEPIDATGRPCVRQ